MKRFVLCCLFTAAAVDLVAGDASAQRVDVYDPALQPITGRRIVLEELVDGGCGLAGVCASLLSTDGGSMLQSCKGIRRELKPGGGQGMCLALLDGAGRLWAGQESVSSADSGWSPDSGL